MIRGLIYFKQSMIRYLMKELVLALIINFHYYYVKILLDTLALIYLFSGLVIWDKIKI